MHLASINSVEEQKNLEEHIRSIGGKYRIVYFTHYNSISFIGMGEEHFWTSGMDQAEESR
jgi:hypothetical protein